jgi:hypothetical protein
MGQPEHSKIINNVARQIFKSYGFERRGQSRVWLDDQGWYTTKVEFQPFMGRQGTCINVGVSFHWYVKDSMSFDMGYRESEFVDFVSIEQFTPEVEKLSRFALDKMLDYRNSFCNIKTAKQIILNHEFTSESLWGNYHKGIICGLTGDIQGLNLHFDELLLVSHDVPWADNLKLKTRQLKEIAPDLLLFRQEIKNIMKQARELKKLKVADVEIK